MRGVHCCFALLGLLAALSCCTTGLRAAASVVFPPPGNMPPSRHYRVWGEAAGGWESSFVYESDSRHRHSFGRSTSWTSLIWRAPLTVRVEPLGRAFETCRVFPSALGIRVRREGGQAVFTLPRPSQVSVEFDGETTHALLVFADAPETDAPSPDSKGVLYFGPGRHERVEPIVLHSGQTLYLAGGAYVCGNVVGPGAKQARICGRGVLSGELLPTPPTHDVPLDYDESLRTFPPLIHFRNVRRDAGGWDGSWKCRVEGVTLVDSPRDNLIFDGAWCSARWVKMIGWFFHTDGIMGGPHLTVEDCLLKVNDDALKLYKSQTTVRRCTLWQMENGACFQFGWNNNTDQSGFLVEDCDVIRTEHFWKTNQNAVFAALHAGSGHLSDYLFRNLRIENVSHRLLNLTMDANKFASNTERGSLSDIVFENLSVSGTQRLPNSIRGYDADHPIANVLFRNLTINGQLITNANQGRFEIDKHTTRSVRFEVDHSQRARTPAKD